MTINLEAYNKLDAGQKMEYLLKHGDRHVNIYSGEHAAYWRSERKGYCTDIKGAGVYILTDALAASAHCGPEKKIKYHFISDQAELPPVMQWRDDEVFNDHRLHFDKYNGIHRGGGSL